jgi:hypothetical protein
MEKFIVIPIQASVKVFLLFIIPPYTHYLKRVQQNEPLEGQEPQLVGGGI